MRLAYKCNMYIFFIPIQYIMRIFNRNLRRYIGCKSSTSGGSQDHVVHIDMVFMCGHEHYNIFGKDTTEKQLQIGKSVISSISAATSLGCILDSKLNMSQHVSRVCKSANYYLHCIRKIRNFISMDACKLLVHTLVMVRLDYCNALLCGAREDVIRQLERLQRQAARVVCKKYKNDHTSVTELMWGLHWLPIRARIQYKILLLVYKAFTNGSPTYLADMMTSCNPVRSTRSSHKVNLLVVPHQKSNKYSEKAFAVVGPRLWNELLTDELRGCNSVDTFKKKLKTMLFKKHY